MPNFPAVDDSLILVLELFVDVEIFWPLEEELTVFCTFSDAVVSSTRSIGTHLSPAHAVGLHMHLYPLITFSFPFSQ